MSLDKIEARDRAAAKAANPLPPRVTREEVYEVLRGAETHLSMEQAADRLFSLFSTPEGKEEGSSRSQPSAGAQERSHEASGGSGAWRELERGTTHISFQDVRLAAGEGKLSTSDVLLAVNAILRRRFDDGAQRLSAAPPAPQGFGGWRDIATAPRDAYARLVWCPERRNIYVVTWHPYDDGWRHFGGDRRLTEVPTHWMPLPEPPSNDLSDRGGEG